MIVKIKLLVTCAALGLLFTACEDDKEETAPRTYPVRIAVGMPGVYGSARHNSSSVLYPVPDVLVKIYQSKEDYVLDQHVLREGLTDENGMFRFDHPTTDTLWFSTQRDTLSNQREVVQDTEGNEITIGNPPSPGNHQSVIATLTNTPTKLRLSVSHLGQPMAGAQVQLYFTEQTYQDSLVAQEDFDHLRPTYGYPRAEASDPEGSFTYYAEEHFLQTTDEAGEVYFENLEPRNYWFRITKDTLSNENTTVRTLRALPRDADITTDMTVGIK